VPSRWQRSRGPIRPPVASSTPTTSAVRNDPSATLLAIDDEAEFVGTVASFTMEGKREVSYWIAPARWGQGLASRALRAFLAIEPTRPIYGRVAHHNAASAKVPLVAALLFKEVPSLSDQATDVAGLQVLQASDGLEPSTPSLPWNFSGNQ
jgi:hypothetical protein